jgi:hypothetical protein
MAKVSNTITIFPTSFMTTNVFIAFFMAWRGDDTMNGTLEAMPGPFAQKVPNINKNRWKGIIFCTWGSYGDRNPFGIRGLDFEAGLSGNTEKKG